MARFWSDEDANGVKLTDGRICLVIQNPEMPEIRTYGKDREEVLDKLANTTETAQLQIQRMRKTSASIPPPNPAARPTGAPAATQTTSDLVTAVADLANPQKAPQAVKTLLKAAGVDVDRQAFLDAVRKVSDIAQQWQDEHPEYPKDPRNDHILAKIAVNMAGGNLLRVTATSFDQAFEEATRLEMFHEPKANLDPAVQPGGSPDSRTVRSATSYRRHALRSAEPPPVPRGDSAQEAKWRTILEKGTSAALAEAIRNEPGFVEWVDKVTAKKTA
jgi:hypothetical protein